MTHVRYANPAENPALIAKIDKLMATVGIEGVMASLTGLQRNFAEQYVLDFNATEATIRAGFNVANKNNARKLGSNLLGHPAIKLTIQHLSNLRAAKSTVDVNYVLDEITKTISEMANKREDPKAAAVLLRATELLARHLGMFVERTELTGKDGGPIETREVQDDADAFTRSIAGLSTRAGTAGEAGDAEPGSESTAEV